MTQVGMVYYKHLLKGLWQHSRNVRTMYLCTGDLLLFVRITEKHIHHK